MPIEEARIPVMDRGFIFGDGVYEVIPVYSRHVFRLADHLKRLQHSLDGIRLQNPIFFAILRCSRPSGARTSPRQKITPCLAWKLEF